jgi:hypothetical protein
MACDYTLKLQAARDENMRAEYAKQIAEALRGAIAITPRERNAITTEEDLQPFVSSEYFSEFERSLQNGK